jgi:hypothetical protein
LSIVVKWITRYFNKNRVKKASQSLEAMQKLVNDYGAILAMLKTSEDFISVDRLPASKPEVKQALISVARVAKSRGDSIEELHKGYMFLAYFVSREEAEIMKRFNEVGRESLAKDVSNSRIAEIIQEMSQNKTHTEIRQRTLDEFSRLFREFEAEVVKPN